MKPRVVPALREAGEKLDGAEGEAILDFSSVHRIDSSALLAMEEFARIADEKNSQGRVTRRQCRRLQSAQADEADAAVFFRELRCTIAFQRTGRN